jgi:pyruvate/2-oxoglutarate dehydrogenase complex dihydrolipoamide acyltransferase (E2) component
MATGTTVQITLPQMGESVTEGTILEWLKQVGDTVELDEGVVEVSTDKVDTEVPSPATGVLTAIYVQADETVPTGTVLGEIDVSGNGGSPPPAAAGTPPASPRSRRPSTARPRRSSTTPPPTPFGTSKATARRSRPRPRSST